MLVNLNAFTFFATVAYALNHNPLDGGCRFVNHAISCNFVYFITKKNDNNS